MRSSVAANWPSLVIDVYSALVSRWQCSFRRPGLGKSFLAIVFFAGGTATAEQAAYRGSSYNEIHNAVFADPYVELPLYKIDREQFGPSGDRPDNRVLAAGVRTLSNPADLLEFPGGQKLFQANGICFAGEWIIHKTSPYGGLFASGARVPVIARASVSLDGTRRKHKRAFGMALKLFPATDPATPVRTHNVFVMHSLGGVRTDRVLDLALDNAPELGALPPFGQWGTALRLKRDFERADEAVSGRSNVEFRPVSQLAGNGPAPRWLRLTAQQGIPRADADDFRDELALANYPGGELRWALAVAEGEPDKKHRAEWQVLGELRLNESVVSAACDRQLHFAHPRIEP